MVLLSTLVACLHLGIRPPDAVWGDVVVQAPVAEPGVDEWVRGAVKQELLARGALAGGPTLDIVVIEAVIEPALRGDSGAPGGGLWYRARLSVRVGQRTLAVTDWVAESGVAVDRERVFRALSVRIAGLIAVGAG